MVVKSTQWKDHQRKCVKGQVSCSGEGCDFITSRDAIGEHEDQCDKIKESCEQCGESVARYAQNDHDCVKALLQKFRNKGKELNLYTQKVDTLALEIHKQQLILEKLNFLNNEKARRITEIENLFEIKKSRPGGSKQFQ